LLLLLALPAGVVFTTFADEGGGGIGEPLTTFAEEGAAVVTAVGALGDVAGGFPEPGAFGMTTVPVFFRFDDGGGSAAVEIGFCSAQKSFTCDPLFAFEEDDGGGRFSGLAGSNGGAPPLEAGAPAMSGTRDDGGTRTFGGG